MRNPRSCRLVALVALALAALAGGGCTAKPTSESWTEQPQPAARAESHDTRRTESPASENRYDLAADEEKGGHTLKKHIGRSDDELRERLARERDISAASTWTDRDAAETTIAAALSAEKNKVQRWIERGYPRPNLALHFNAGRTIGRSLRRGYSQVVPCTAAVIVLKPDGPKNFHVLTAYPEAER